MTGQRYYKGMEPPKQNNLEVALKIARAKLADSNPQELADRTGGQLTEFGDKTALKLDFVGDSVTVTLPEGKGYFAPEAPLPDFFLVMVLHYLVSEGTRLKNQKITYVQCPSGKFYEGPFNKHTKDRMLQTFGEEVKLLKKVAQELGWQMDNEGDVAATAYLFPKVPISFVLYGQDEDFEPDLNIFFDKSIIEFLPEEDIKLVSGLLVSKACKKAEEIRGEKI